MQTENARSQELWWEKFVEWLFVPKNWYSSIVTLILTNAVLFAIAWVAGLVAVPDRNLMFAKYVAGISLGLDLVLLLISFVRHGELREGTLAFYMGSQVGLAVMCVVWLVLGAIWLGIQAIGNFALPPSLGLVTITTLVVGVIFGLLIAAVASSD